MCFVITDPEPKIADRDIKCYKVGFIRDDGFHPVCSSDFKYSPNKKYKTKLGIYGDAIEEGFHSYISESKGKEEQIDWCLVTPREAEILATFIIPKGATYYENGTEYVSNQIIWKS